MLGESIIYERETLPEADRSQSAIHSRLGWPENVHFLEKFRYLIVASQLLNERSNIKPYERPKLPPPAGDGIAEWETEVSFIPSPRGVVLTIVISFALAGSIRWISSQTISSLSVSATLLFLLLIGVATVALYYYFRRQWLQYLRVQAVESATFFIATSQDFDAAASTGISLVQEVELVSRGYNMYVYRNLECRATNIHARSTPLPPITRLEESSQIKRCAQLRRIIHRSLISMFAPYYEAYQSMKIRAIDVDLGKYYDVYEISRTDIEDAELVANVTPSDIADADTLQDLRVDLQKFHVIRKLLLCALLALDADGSKADFRNWSDATDAMKRITSITAKMAFEIDDILGNEEGKFDDI